MFIRWIPFATPSTTLLLSPSLGPVMWKISHFVYIDLVCLSLKKIKPDQMIEFHLSCQTKSTQTPTASITKDSLNKFSITNPTTEKPRLTQFPVNATKTPFQISKIFSVDKIYSSIFKFILRYTKCTWNCFIFYNIIWKKNEKNF